MRVLLVEDDPLLGDGIKTALQREGYAVDWLDNGREAMAAARYDDFSVMVLDLGLPDVDGLKVLEAVRGRGSLPVLILTARDDIDSRLAGLDGGADDYVLKPFDLAELLARLRVVTRRAEGRASQYLDVGELRIDEARHRVSWQGEEIPLTRREYALLLELARHADRVMTRPRLENLLYGWEEEVASNAVEVHVHHLRKKFHKGLITTIRGVGYRLNAADA
ncbi:Transcriptional regulatory protein QseB [Halomonas sp. THAF12]|uniref:response regulator n=1 Tax=Halomonas sp. THAF12 TaxID=2587849 RepID=UPI001267C793|nr:response regulator transcription factor [Halomonas sp. THAF12]QFT83932.1 Transcriptional regulatory protein QseB [Halomonas sp. THAF12]